MLKKYLILPAFLCPTLACATENSVTQEQSERQEIPLRRANALHPGSKAYQDLLALMEEEVTKDLKTTFQHLTLEDPPQR